ncbi:adenylosuccinate lyase [Sporomusa acidovorans]|uniref:Adenylosuccinate lyase n=1 Tax=Sporomusa acidovorans (strain ATCC 49682 / DSM 3132 / Mol) TaxID=1123286 RepID=A0ABZ3J9M2_SPOA4|nr:adenylosuccinate lyase [Sporomusa acidovorans]OZC16216.1 adenylosuccinate lyase [Sporomusa acidovorans DSM 3132]SDE31637.1 Adenylosuccinate lyase [Sporomusa acidovorans]
MSIKSLTPLEGRYESITRPLGNYFSEWALIKYRLHVEIEWLIAMAGNPAFGEIRPFTPAETAFLRNIVNNFDETAALRIKEIERTTNHDVKAVEYFLRETLGAMSLADILEFIHFSCTSEDINNLSYALMLKHGIEDVWLPAAESLVEAVTAMAEEEKAIPMLAHTHGQAASPTTVGKELAVFVYRWNRQLKQIRSQEYLGKFNGAVGNFNAHSIAYPEVDWEAVSRSFVEGLGLTYNPLTTQIEAHDYVAESFHALTRFNNILLDFDRDMWLYISLSYFKQKAIAGEVGSSTMPHKVNPIDFENSEANLGLSNAVLDHLANKLPISRLQRDLSDSSAQRNIGTGIAHSLIAITYTVKGLRKTVVNKDALTADLNHAWEVLAEAVQTVMRKHGHANSYDKLKAITRGKGISEEDIKAFIQSVELPAADKQRLLALTPSQYVGIAASLVKHIR